MAQLSQQTEAQRAAFREQTRRLLEEHGATVETLQSHISRLEKQLFALQSQSSKGPRSDRQSHRSGVGFQATGTASGSRRP